MPKERVEYVKAGHMFDSVTGRYRENVVLFVVGERIRSVDGPGSTIPAGATVVDLSQEYVLPGLIDCHTHLGARADRYDPINSFLETPFTSAYASVNNARATLMAGFTTVRDVGSMPFQAVDLRNAINAGEIPGPRMVASGPILSITGGHGDLNNYSPEVRVSLYPEHRDYSIADGPEQVREQVREQVKYGVDVIKISASGGVLSKGDQPGAPQYSLEELKMAAETAHQAGRKIAAHAHGATSIRWAIEAGIDSIEHASLVDDEGIRMAKQHGTYFVMDIYDDDYILGNAKNFGIPEEMLVKERGRGQGAEGELPEGVEGGGEDGVWDGCGGVSAWGQCEAVPLHGDVRDDGGGGDPGGDDLGGGSDWACGGCGGVECGSLCGSGGGAGGSVAAGGGAGAYPGGDEGRCGGEG